MSVIDPRRFDLSGPAVERRLETLFNASTDLTTRLDAAETQQGDGWYTLPSGHVVQYGTVTFPAFGAAFVTYTQPLPALRGAFLRGRADPTGNPNNLQAAPMVWVDAAGVHIFPGVTTAQPMTYQFEVIVK